MELFKPKGAQAIRWPTDNQQQNGQVYNTPRYAAMGGLDAPGKIGKKSGMSLSKPGDTKKVI